MAIIDLGLDVPFTVAEVVDVLKTFFGRSEKRGLANYSRIFGPRWLSALGLSEEDVRKMQNDLSPDEFEQKLQMAAQYFAVSQEKFMAEMDKANLEWGLIISPDNQKTANFISLAPERLKGLASVDLSEGVVVAVNSLEQAVQDLGMVACHLTAFRDGIPVNNARYYPIYAKAVALKIPVFVYTAMNYRNDLPMDVAHPRYLDQIAVDFPELKLVAAYGGWPWVPDLVGIARRHPNLFINIRANRPKYLAQPGSGWEMLLQFGNTLIQDQIVFASGAGELGVPVHTLIEEVENLPLKESVKEKWLYKNAQRLFES